MKCFREQGAKGKSIYFSKTKTSYELKKRIKVRVIVNQLSKLFAKKNSPFQTFKDVGTAGSEF